jgi:hypothetical protein
VMSRGPLTSHPLQRCGITTCEDLQEVAKSTLVNGMELNVAVLMCLAAVGLS